MSSRPVLHLYQASSKYSVGYSCYRAETRNQIQTQEVKITPKVKKKAEAVILVCDMSSGPVLNYYQVSSNYSKECSTYIADTKSMWPWWLSWMRRPTGDQEVVGSTPAEVSNILSWRLLMKYFLRSFSPFCWFKKGSCQFLSKECAQYWLTA